MKGAENTMRFRNHSVLIRLTEEERCYLKEQAEIAGLKVEPYLRSLILGSRLKPHPPDAYLDLLRELSAIGNNLNQIARIANATRRTQNGELYEAQQLVKEAVRLVRESF